VHAAAAKPAATEAIITTPSGLQYVDHVVGTGEKPTPGAIVQVCSDFFPRESVHMHVVLCLHVKYKQ